MSYRKTLLILFIALTAIPIGATEFVVNRLNYRTMSNGEVECTGFANGQGSGVYNILIPGRVTYNGTEYRVNRIASNAFKNNTTLKDIQLDWGIVQVSTYAFSGCTSVTNVRLPSTMTTIGNYAFENCTAMTTFACAAPTSPTVSVNAFSGMRKCNIYTPHANDTEPADDYNRYTAWTNADSDGAVSADGTKAYDFVSAGRYYVIHTGRAVNSNSAKATLVGVNSSVTYIPITNVTNSNPVTYGACTSGYTASVTRIADYACQDNTNITSVGRSDLGDYTGFENVGEHAFENCTSLQSIGIPCGKIGMNAFTNCTALADIKLYGSTESLGVSQIDYYSFENTAISSVYIPSSTNTINNGAFRACSNLNKITVSSNNTQFTSNSSGHLYSKNYTLLYQVGGANENNDIDYRCTFVGSYAFYGNTQITELDIPYGVTGVGQQIIGESAIESLKVPSSVTSFSFNFLGKADNIKVLYINKSSIPNSLVNVSQAVHPNAILCVPKGAIPAWNADTYWRAAFPGGIYEGAYDLCGEIQILHQGEYYTVISTDPYTDTNVQADAAKGKIRLVAGKHVVPGSGFYYTLNNNRYTAEIKDKFDGYIVTEIERDMFKGETLITGVSGGNGVKRIGAQAFANCPQFYSMNLNYIEQIGDSAFFNCTGMAGTYTFPESLLTVGIRAFYGCTGINAMIFPRTGLNKYTFLNVDAYGNNASDFKCYVPMRHLNSVRDHVSSGWIYTGTAAKEKIHPFLKPESTWTTLTTCSLPLSYPTTATFYTVTDYDATTRKVTTAKVSGNLPADSPLLLKVTSSNVDKYIKLTVASSATALGDNLLMPGTKDGVSIKTDNYFGDYLLNTSNNRFEKITSTTTVYNDVAYLHIEGQAASRYSQYQIDEIYYRGFKYGNFWYDFRNGTENDTELTVISPQRGDSYNTTTMEIPATFTYNGAKRTVREVEGGAFTGQLVNYLTLPESVDIIRTGAFTNATRLKRLIISYPYSPSYGIIEDGIAGGNDADFKCYVRHRYYNSYSTKLSGINVCTWITFENSNYLPFSAPFVAQLPNGVKAYTIPSYNTGKRLATTSEVSGNVIPSHTGVLLKSNKSTNKLLIEKTTGDISLGANYLKPYTQSSEFPSELPNQVPFFFNHEDLQWVSTINIAMGDAFLSIPTSEIGSDRTSPVFFDLEYTDPIQQGDVNADGSINAGDVSAIYNVMLGIETDEMIIARADVNNDGSVNAGDVSMVYSIMLNGE